MPRHVGLLLVALSVACSRPAPPFSEENARAHVTMLAGTIGSRAVGTPANGRARDYLIEQLQINGFDVRVHDVDAERADVGLTARVSNIVATRRGARSDTLALVAHYDSSPDAPGATDDGFGVAVVLEAARQLAARSQSAHTLMVILTDAEEAGLLGAAVAVKDPAIVGAVRVVLNFDSIGSDVPAMLFETGPQSGALVRTWAAAAPQPRGSSYASEIYRRLPNDTDFTIFRRAGLPGLNFAAIGDSYAYHTARDVPDRVTGRVLRQAGENLVAIVERLDRTGLEALEATSPGGTYFDVGGRLGVSYGDTASRGVALGAIVLGLLAWLQMIRGLRNLGDPRWLQTIVWAMLGFIVVAGGLVGTTWALRATREVYHPWYAYPERLFALLAVTGFVLAWAVWRGASRLPVRLRANGHPLAIWLVTLPVWIAATIIMQWRAPSAAHLWTIPLGAAGVLLNVVLATSASLRVRSADDAGSATLKSGPTGVSEPASLKTGPTAVRIASVGVLAVAGTLWLPDLVLLLPFTVAVFGRLSIVTSVYVYAGMMLAAGSMVVPPLLASLVGRARPWARPGIWTAVWLTGWVVAAGLAYAAPAYTYERPLRRQARYVYDQGTGRAFWEVGGNEPGLDVHPTAAGGAEWQRVSGTPSTTIPLQPLGPPFTFRASGAAPAAPPATLAATLLPRGDEIDLEIVASAAEPGIGVAFVLPPGIRPLKANLPGVVSPAGRWHATYLAPPPSGVAFRATFDGGRSDVLLRTAVVLTTSGLPGGTGWQRLPAWLPQDLAVWSGTAVYILPALVAGRATALRPARRGATEPQSSGSPD